MGWDQRFFASVFPSKSAIFDRQSSQMRQLRKKMREENELCHSLTYIRSCSMPLHRYNILQKALFVDIKVLIDMIDSNLFQSNEEIEAFSRQIWQEFFEYIFSNYFYKSRTIQFYRNDRQRPVCDGSRCDWAYQEADSHTSSLTHQRSFSTISNLIICKQSPAYRTLTDPQVLSSKA